MLIPVSRRVFILFAILFIVFGRTVFALDKVQHYDTAFLKCTDKQVDWLALRTFELNGHSALFLVHPQTLQTAITLKKDVQCSEAAPSFVKNSTYENLRKRVLTNRQQLKNAGLQSFQTKGVFLTVDLCPSRKPYEKALFTWAAETKSPLGIAITGRWIQEHQDEFQELLNLKNQGVPITWINHTHNHPYNRKAPIEKNFLLTPGTNLDREILGNEIAMIQNGLTPSVFFRFPGLVSNSNLVDEVLTRGLVPLGAEAWLALGQKAQDGSVVLVHGNGNEPHGIQLFFKFLDQIAQLGFRALPGGA